MQRPNSIWLNFKVVLHIVKKIEGKGENAGYPNPNKGDM